MFVVNLFRNTKFTEHMRNSIRLMKNTHNVTGNGTSKPYRMNETANIYSLLQIFKITFLSTFYV